MTPKVPAAAARGDLIRLLNMVARKARRGRVTSGGQTADIEHKNSKELQVASRISLNYRPHLAIKNEKEAVEMA